MFYRIYAKLINFLMIPLVLRGFFRKEVGGAYWVGFQKKLWLCCKAVKAATRIQSGTSWRALILMAEKILSVPKSLPGYVAECGPWKGSSTATLSLVCRLAGRKLLVFDSFKGLPSPRGNDNAHHLLGTNAIATYEKGDFTGALEEVKANIKKYGAIEVCEFIEGYFSDTLPGFNKKLVFVYTDVDLRESLKDCLDNLWPHLQDNCYWFTDEAQHEEMAKLFYEKGIPLVGAGSGICFGSGLGGSIGYAIKNKSYTQTVPQNIT